MKIEPKSIKVKDIFDGYADNGDNGVLHMTVGLQFDRLIKENLYIVQNRLNLLFIRY